jgi:putative ABC transport system permease protein
LARELAPNGDAIGKIFQIQPTQPLKVIGIVKDYYRPGSNSEHSYKQYYLPYAAFRDIGFEIKLKAGARLERSAILPLLHSVDSSLKIQLLTDYTTQHAKLIYKHRLTAGLTISLAILALLLAGAGIYGILNYSTQMRRSELGIHLALGAKTHRVQNMVLKENLKPIILGFLSSFVIAMGIYLVIRQNFEFTLTPDFGMVAITIPIIVAMSFIACYLPVKAIINNDPIKALRNE